MVFCHVGKLLRIFVILCASQGILYAMQHASSSVSVAPSAEQENEVYGVSYADIDKTFESAPMSIKNWAQELQVGTQYYKKMPYRLFIYGIPGVGKTTMAYAIMKANPNWIRVKLDAAQTIRSVRGGAVEEMNKKFTRITDALDAGRKCIVLIDEVHLLMRNHTNSAYDTYESTAKIQNLLDTYLSNPNVMIILTGNDASDVTSAMDSRIGSNTVEILPPTPQELCELFPFYAHDFSCDSIPCDVLMEVLRTGDIKTGRDIKSFAGMLFNEVRDSGYMGNMLEYQLTKDFLMRMARLFKEKHSIRPELTDREFAQQQAEKSEREAERRHKESLQASNSSNRNAMIMTGVCTAATISGSAYVAHIVSSKKSQNSDQAQSSSSNVQEAASQPSSTSLPEQSATNGANSTNNTPSRSRVAEVLGGISAAGAALAKTKVGAASVTIFKVIGAAAQTHPYVAAATAVGVTVAGGAIYYFSKKNSSEPDKAHGKEKAEKQD